MVTNITDIECRRIYQICEITYKCRKLDAKKIVFTSHKAVIGYDSVNRVSLCAIEKVQENYNTSVVTHMKKHYPLLANCIVIRTGYQRVFVGDKVI